jgi:RNA polymerase sigma-70 factor (ECF subfamily)
MFKQEELVSEMANLRKFALRLTKNVSDSEDLLQATVLRALEKKDYFQEDTNLFSWSSKIMFNLFVSQYRHKKKFETQYDPTHYLEQVVTGPSQEASTDLATVRESMKKLSKEHYEILVLVCIQGMRYEEVAESLDIPVGTVRSRLSRARQQLQDMLAPQKESRGFMPLPAATAKALKPPRYQSVA